MMRTLFTLRLISQIGATGILIGIGVILGLPKSLSAQIKSPPSPNCRLTPEDSLGPFYKPGAPVRSIVGKGYELTGRVKSVPDCSPVSGAMIEFWLAGPDGKYDDAHRAIVYSDEMGRYIFESNFPPRYSSRPPHIHIRVSAPGHKILVAQYYPKKGESKGAFDLVIAPDAAAS